MLLMLRGKSKDRIEVHWAGEIPAQVTFKILQENAVLGSWEMDPKGKLNLSLEVFDLSQCPEAKLELVANIDGHVSEAIVIQKCPYSDCQRWGHVRNDGYCKHCGRPVQKNAEQSEINKLENSVFEVELYNGVKGKLSKHDDAYEYDNILYSLGEYQDEQHPLSRVDILEEKFDARWQGKYPQLTELIANSSVLSRYWSPPLPCFQEDEERTLWIYYPSLLQSPLEEQHSAYSYICSPDIPALGAETLLQIGITLCDIALEVRHLGFSWGGTRLSDLIFFHQQEHQEFTLRIRSRDITWQGPVQAELLESCLLPWEVYWNAGTQDLSEEVSEVYVIGAILYFLKAKSPNLLSYNHLSYHQGLPSLKLFREAPAELLPQGDVVEDYLESLINQAMILHPQDRGYQTIAEFREAMIDLFHLAEKPFSKEDRYILDVGEGRDVGDEKREDDLTPNQDTLFATTVNLEKKGWGIFVLCDGISTATVGAGEQASEIIKDTFVNWWQESSEEEREAVCAYACTDFEKACKFLNDLVDQANEKIRKQCHEYLQTGEFPKNSLIMGSTVTAGIIYKGVLVFGWAGDSPVFRFSKLGWERLNYQDNERNLRLLAGMPLEECYIEGGNAITRCVGAHFFEEATIQMNFVATLIRSDEVILICSDGLPDYIEQESHFVAQENYHMLRLSSIIEAYKNDPLIDAKALVGILISSANRVGGGYDNLSAILLRSIPYSMIHFGESYERLRSLYQRKKGFPSDVST